MEEFKLQFWPGVFQMHIRAIEAFRDAALEKVVPAFGNIANEAAATTNEKYPGDDDSVAEQAIEHYAECLETLSDVRQGMVNLLTVGLYHLFEQQQKLTTNSRESAMGFKSAGKIYELKMAANAIKHGEGNSAKQLARLRPDLFFRAPAFSEPGSAKDHHHVQHAELVADDPMLAPLTGDIYVSEGDLAEWCDAVVAFWEETGDVHAGQRHERVARGKART